MRSSYSKYAFWRRELCTGVKWLTLALQVSLGLLCKHELILWYQYIGINYNFSCCLLAM